MQSANAKLLWTSVNEGRCTNMRSLMQRSLLLCHEFGFLPNHAILENVPGSVPARRWTHVRRQVLYAAAAF